MSTTTSAVRPSGQPGKVIPGGRIVNQHTGPMYAVGPHPALYRNDHACLGLPEDMFFAPDGPEGRGWKAYPGRRVCRRCVVLEDCRAWAIAAGPELHGLYGATTAKERDAIRAERRREMSRAAS
jgi:WhiB family transcriptional regulator, redox-sensing transcriptional regulator